MAVKRRRKPIFVIVFYNIYFYYVILGITIFQIETREDEEQSNKLQEILDLLIAAGYFRARIKGLSPFDKVWTILLLIVCNL